MVCNIEFYAFLPKYVFFFISISGRIRSRTRIQIRNFFQLSRIRIRIRIRGQKIRILIPAKISKKKERLFFLCLMYINQGNYILSLSGPVFLSDPVFMALGSATLFSSIHLIWIWLRRLTSTIGDYQSYGYGSDSREKPESDSRSTGSDINEIRIWS